MANEERVALVTGANRGIGWAIAERLAEEGYAVAFHSRSDDEESRNRFEALSERTRAWRLHGDLADPLVPERLAAETLDRLGRLDVLVNNAGSTLAKRVQETTREDFDAVFAVDVRAAFLLSQAAAEAMAEGGAIVNVTSVHEHVPRAGFAVYAAAKAALGMLTRSFALELGPAGIR